jgi:DNA (cytosine-5)-methyltransferase 1
MADKALDLCCCAGGATKGLQQLGFHVTGVDINPQPRYCGDAFFQGDALDFPLEDYDFIWASPPCQAFSRLRHLHRKERPNLIPAIRQRLLNSGKPYCIENVEESPLGDSGHLIMLCGTMFGLQTKNGRAELRRHRLFETSFSIPLRPRCQHGYVPSLSVVSKGGHFTAPKVLTVTGHTPVDNTGRRTTPSVVGTGLDDNRMRASRPRSISITGSVPQTNVVRNIVRETFTVEQAREAMGIDWMSMKGLSQAVPPAYSKFIGEAFLKQRNVLQFEAMVVNG